ncbi:SMC-Scp complex subunit ScpB [Acidicapsa ligni]|uniref:SMC-Scp complex subunit ScpB n=1 Tax=Acidicapsa ligni TaxID=542300 RepID=UPI0021E0C8DB|nr:SMC-Scp complex subunit ScpB [Acidicapsa ligni]
MSLKAKLEAVIYAAEEPITLAQMAVLFADEALEWKAELAAQRAEENAEAQLDLGPPAELDAVIESAAEPATVTEEAAVSMGSLEVSDSAASLVSSDLTVAPDQVDLGDLVDSAASSETLSEAAAAVVVDPELEAKRLARLRDREIREILRGLLDELLAEYASAPRGIEIREIAGGYRMATKPECHDAVRAFVKSLKPPLKLSLPALETLAVIAYKQPITAPEVGEIRGVDSAGVLGSLISRKLISTAGRKQVVGRPMLYKTTKEFLLRFGLKDVAELPSMEEFEKMAAIELSETDDTDLSAESGNLFAEAESSEDAPESDHESGRESGQESGKEESETSDPVRHEPEATETSTPTAEPSQEAAEAHAPVERQDAEEIEAEP